MIRNILAIILMLSTAITSFISYDIATYQGGHANVIAFALSMYVLSITCVYSFNRMRGIF